MLKFIFLSAGLLLGSSMIYGEEADTSAMHNIYLNEVVVQTFKQAKTFGLEPVSASAFNSTSLTNRNITGIKEFSALVPNLFMPDYGAKISSPVYIRGIGSKINAPSVGLYVDGIPYFEKSAFDFDLSEIDRIEVLRGPQGTLYGRNTMGGIINIFTKSPLAYQGTNLFLSGGNYGQRQISASHYGKTNNTFGYSVSGNYSHTDGFFTNLATGKKADQQDVGSGRVKLEWILNPALTLKVMSNIDYLDQGGYPYALYDKETNTTGQVNYNDFSSYKRTLSNSGATLDYKTNSIWLTSQTSFQYLSDRQGIDQDYSTKNQYFVVQKQQQRMASEELNIKSVNNSWYKWLFGAFGFYQGINNDVAMDYKLQAMSTHKLYDSPTYGFALYHQSTFDNILTDGLSLTLGVRYDWERAKTDYTAYRTKNDTTGMTDNFVSKVTFSEVTPKITLQYTFPSDQQIYASVCKGYKTGGFNTSFEKKEDRSFDPEYSWNYETGTKLQFFESRLKAEVSLFYIDWRNQQIYQPLPSGTGSMLKNAGRSESKGIEASLQGNIGNGLDLQATYGYTKATFKKYEQSEDLNYNGKYLPMVPSHTFSLAADYMVRVKSEWLDRVMFNLTYCGTGKIYWNENNEDYQSYYGVINAKTSFVKGPVTIALWGKNLTDTDYTAYYFKSSQGKSFAQKGKPLTFGVNMAFNF